MPRVFAALAATVALSLLSRLWPVGWPVDHRSRGDVLYAAADYLALALALPRRRPALVAALALALCLVVESFQATGIPARYAHLGPVRWLLGTTFSWHDVACYGVGVAGTFGLDVLLLRPRGRKR
jgi:hypothetical protein